MKKLKRNKRIFIVLISFIILLGILIYSGIKIFSNKNINDSKILAYIYDGEKHDMPPAKNSGYEIDVVNCDKAVGEWNNSTWELTLKEIEGKTTCILNFKKEVPTHTLEIDPNGGTFKGNTGIISVDVDESKKIEIQNPSRKGYTFVGWNVEGENSQISDNIFTMGKEDSKIIAKWQINSYEIEISGTNKCDRKETIEYNAQIELCEPELEGYTFVGWETTSGRIEGNTFICEDSSAKITPKYVANNYDYIVYHKLEGLNGEYTIKDSNTYDAAFDTSVSPEVMTYEGFTSPQKQTITITTENNKVEYYYTRNRYNLTINPGQGSTPTELNQQVKYEQKVQIKSPTRKGYNFTGWSGATLQDEELTMPAKDVNLTANYEAKTVTLYFDANQGSVTTSQKSVTYDSTYGELPTPTRTGYNFNGWYINGEKIESTSKVQIDVSTSALAHWSKAAYTLSVNPNEGTYKGSTSINETTMLYQDEATIDDPSKEGYTFDGWEVNGTGATFNTSTKKFKMGSSNATLSAKWKINKYKLTIQDSNTCDGVYEIDYHGTKELCTPTKEGYIFIGWEDTDNIINNNVATMKAKDSTIKAKWTANTYDYIVYHNKMNIDGTTYTRVDADTYKGSSAYGTVVVTNAKSYTGFKSQSNKSITIGVESNNPPTKNVVNYNYERNKYTLTIQANGGTYTGTTPLDLYYEQEITIPNPTKTGYNFSGWEKSGNSTITDNKLKMGTENTTLTAKYTAKTYIVTFNANNGSVTTNQKSVTYDQTYGELPTPIRTDYDFEGWYTDATNGTKINSTDTVKITNNQTLYAHWKLKTYTITYNANGGSVSPSSVQVAKGNSINSLPTPTRSGYTFLGWYTSTSGGTKITTSTTFNSSQTIYAQWYLIENAVTKIRNIGVTSTTAYDGTTDNNLRYISATPNNYVKFNNELWRIIGVMNNIENSSGVKQSLLKIIRNESLGEYSWDTCNGIYDSELYCPGTNCGFGINQWGPSGSYEGADLMRELNYDYLGNVQVGTDGYWYSGKNNAKSTLKPNSSVSTSSQNLIENVVWKLGTKGNSDFEDYSPINGYVYERSNNNGKICSNNVGCNDSVSRTTSWVGKIALIYPSDYGFATAGGSNMDRNTCLQSNLYDWSYSSGIYYDCKNNNWLYKNLDYRCLTPDTIDSDAYYVFAVKEDGKATGVSASKPLNIYPSLYLKSTVNIINGSGAESDPYILALP